MAKEVTGFIKLQIKGGAANPAPPVGPALGSKGLNIMDFCKQFKQPPVAVSLKEAAKISKASGEPNRKKVATVTWDQVKEIAQSKMPDLNAFTLRSAMSMVAGTARSMGIKVEGQFPENI